MYTGKQAGVDICIREIYNRLPASVIQANSITCYTYSLQLLNGNITTKIIKLPFLNALFKKSISLHRIIWNMLYLPALARNYDIVYSFSSHGGFFIKNQVLTVHDLISLSFPAQHRFQFFYFKYILPGIINSSKKIVAISAFTKQQVIDKYKLNPAKICVIYNGGNHLKPVTKDSTLQKEKEVLEAKINGRSFFLLVGATYPHKNADTVIKAMQSMPGYMLIITGAGNKYLAALQQLADQQQIKNVNYILLVLFV